MSDTTSIDDLPTDPSTGNQNNIIIQKTEMNVLHVVPSIVDCRANGASLAAPVTRGPYSTRR
jgi:hypothetical protein